MRKVIILLSVLVAVSCFAVEKDDDHLWLRVEGRYIVNSRGEAYMGMGPNLFYGGWANYCRGGSVDDWMAHVKAMGVNCVRYGMDMTDDRTQPDPLDVKLDEIADFVSACKKVGLYCILDAHVFKAPVTRYERWSDKWQEIAERFKDEPWIVGYELWNEPYGGQGVFGLDEHAAMYIDYKDVREATLGCIRKIREKDTRHIIFVPSKDWDHSTQLEPTWGKYIQEHGSPDTIDPAQIVYVFHDYPPVGTADVILAPIDAFQDKYNVPCYHTETGVLPGHWGRLNEAMYTERIIDLFEQQIPRKLGISLLMYFADNYPGGCLYQCLPEDHWIPMAREYGTPPCDNGTPSQVIIKLEPHYGPPWNNPGMVADPAYKSELTIEICDTFKVPIRSANGDIAVSVTGPAKLSAGAAVKAVNGIARIPIESTGKPGTVKVTAQYKGIPAGTFTFPCAATWTKFEVQKKDGTWVDGTRGTTDDTTPNCRIRVQYPVTGLDVSTADIEYSTDGGNTWMSRDTVYTDEFDDGVLDEGWTDMDFQAKKGSAVEANGVLAITGAGKIWREYHPILPPKKGEDSCHVVCKKVPRDAWEAVTKINSQEETTGWAKAGIWVRHKISSERDNAAAVLAVTPKNGIVLEWCSMGRQNRDKEPHGYICDRFQADVKVKFPVYLKLVKVRKNYAGYYSQDGVNWAQVGTRSAAFREEWYIENMENLTVGLFANSGHKKKTSTAEFDFFRVNRPAACTGKDLSKDVEIITAEEVPLSGDAMIRFRIRDSFQYFDLNPGEQLISPEFQVRISAAK